MMDLIDEGPGGAPDNAPELSVSEISGAVKRVIEGEFAYVRVRGEVGRVSRPRSGHVYMDLKDDRSVLAGVMWKGVAARQQTQPEEGMEVVATGRLTTFPGQSRYQIVIEDIRPAGLGALMAMLEKRKAALAAEGLFAPERKKSLPFLPEVIGVVTSPSGAVIRDILHRLRDRFPRKVLIWPVAVQGASCAPEVARAIAGFNRLTPGGALPRPDLLIVARGGGSVEDLWGFNEEVVARAAAASEIPLISAVGHETDTTLIDFVSDQRAPTPTAAAELAVPVRLDLLGRVDEAQARMTRAMGLRIETRGQRLRDLARAMPRPGELLDGPRQRLDVLGERLPQTLVSGVERRRALLSEVAGSLRPSLLRRAIAVEDARLKDRAARSRPALDRLLSGRREALEQRAARLSPRAVTREIATGKERLSVLSRRFEAMLSAGPQGARQKLDTQARMLETLSYKGTLERGYAVVRGEGGVVTTKAAAQDAVGLEIEFSDGRLKLGGGRAPKVRKSGGGSDQGSLF